jgi:hypothetical protein
VSQPGRTGARSTVDSRKYPYVIRGLICERQSYIRQSKNACKHGAHLYQALSGVSLNGADARYLADQSRQPANALVELAKSVE